MSAAAGADEGDAGEYELALLEMRLGELAGEVRELYRRALSLEDRVVRVAGGYEVVGSGFSRASRRSSM